MIAAVMRPQIYRKQAVSNSYYTRKPDVPSEGKPPIEQLQVFRDDLHGTAHFDHDQYQWRRSVENIGGQKAWADTEDGAGGVFPSRRMDPRVAPPENLVKILHSQLRHS